MSDRAKLLISCPDARGIISAVTGFIAEHGGNILELDQHSDEQHNEFFMRLEIETRGFSLDTDTFEKTWTPIAKKFDMRWHIDWGTHPKRLAIMVSKEAHCLNDLLWRWQSKELQADICCVISNHSEARTIVESAGLPFYHLPVDPQTKAAQEARILGVLAEHRCDVIVMARYMQILTNTVLDAFVLKIINIHHSFLPAFAGPKPYHQAYHRGVKIIGATSHYATEVLDEGPIICQSTLAVDHRDTIDDLVRKGRDLERIVLANAVRLHVEDKTLVSKNKTIVFE